MTMLSVAQDVSMALTRLVVETDEDALVPQLHHKELPMPDWGFGLLAVVLFALGLAAVWSFRHTAAKLGGTEDHPADPSLDGPVNPGHGARH